MTAVSEPSLGPAVNIVDAFTQNLKEMKIKKKATRVRSIEEENPASSDAPTLAGALQLGAKKDRKAGRRLPRKNGGSNNNLVSLAEEGAPAMPRCSTDNCLSLLGRAGNIKEKAGGTVDPDELLKRRRAARAAGGTAATTTNNNNTSTASGRKTLGRRGPSSGKLSATNLAQIAQQMSQNNLNRMPSNGPALHRSTTDPTISLQARMEKLKQKQKEMPDPDEMLEKRRENRRNKTSKLFGSAPSLPGMTVLPQDREQRRIRRTNSRGKRLSRTTSAGRIHDEMEVPSLAHYSVRRAVTDSDRYAKVEMPALVACAGESAVPALMTFGDSAKSA